MSHTQVVRVRQGNFLTVCHTRLFLRSTLEALGETECHVTPFIGHAWQVNEHDLF